MKASVKWANCLFVAAFLTFLLFMGYQSWRQDPQKVSFYENRALADYPKATVANIGNGSYFTALETALCDHSAYRTSFLKLGTAVDLTLGRPVVNTVVPTAEGAVLPYHEYRPVDEEKILDKAESITDGLAALQAQVESYGGTFLYVAVPDQSSYYAHLYPSYLNNRAQTAEAETAAFYAAAAAKGISVLNVAEGWATQEGDYMSKVDHHFTFEGGFSVYEMILEKLGEKGKKADFSVQKAENPYIGSRALRLCNLIGEEEAFYYGVPKEEIPFTRYDWGSNIAAPSATVTLPESGEPIQYGAYMGGDMGQTVLQTHRADLADCLIIGDSFTNLLEGLLYTAFDETRSLDYRYYEEKTMSDYVAEYRPQVVIMVRDTANLLNDQGNGNIQ